MNLKNLVVSMAMAGAIVSMPAFAAPTYYTDRATFDAATGGGLSFESFEVNFSTSDTISFTDFTVSETLGDNILGQLRDFPGLVNGITDGTGALGYDDNGDSIGTFFSFTIPVTAFGMDITTNPGATVTIGGNASDTLTLVADSPSFWGVVDPDGITSLTFDASGGPNVAFDAASYGESMTYVDIDIDIKFCSDPNAFNCKKNGVLPVTIFGTDTFDVADIDTSTLQLCLASDPLVCTGAPRNWSIADRGDPSSDLGAGMCALDPTTGEELDYLTQDGFLDLDAAFEASDVQAMLDTGFCDLSKNAVSEDLIITGSTLGGIQIQSVPVSNPSIDQLVKKNKR